MSWRERRDKRQQTLHRRRREVATQIFYLLLRKHRHPATSRLEKGALLREDCGMDAAGCRDGATSARRN